MYTSSTCALPVFEKKGDLTMKCPIEVAGPNIMNNDDGQGIVMDIGCKGTPVETTCTYSQGIPDIECKGTPV